jgi:arylformamidase
VKTVDIDYLSAGGYKRNASDVHRTLLGAGIWIIEGLDLSQIKPGRYYLICLPLKLENGDGAPARVVLRPV